MADKAGCSTISQKKLLLTTTELHGCSVTTSSQKVLDKLNRKDRRRAERAGANVDADWLAVHGVALAALPPSAPRPSFILSMLALLTRFSSQSMAAPCIGAARSAQPRSTGCFLPEEPSFQFVKTSTSG